jgi:hypothetical protein
MKITALMFTFFTWLSAAMPMEKELDHLAFGRAETGGKKVRAPWHDDGRFLSDAMEMWRRLAVWLGDVIEDRIQTRQTDSRRSCIDSELSCS